MIKLNCVWFQIKRGHYEKVKQIQLNFFVCEGWDRLREKLLIRNKFLVRYYLIVVHIMWEKIINQFDFGQNWPWKYLSAYNNI